MLRQFGRGEAESGKVVQGGMHHLGEGLPPPVREARPPRRTEDRPEYVAYATIALFRM